MRNHSCHSSTSSSSIARQDPVKQQMFLKGLPVSHRCDQSSILIITAEAIAFDAIYPVDIPTLIQLNGDTMSYIDALPNEILTKIIALSLRSAQHPTPLHLIPDHANDLGRLQLVCWRWNDIAVSTPHLWTLIHLYLPRPHLSKSGLKLWLARSKTLFIHVSIVFEPVESDKGLCGEESNHKLLDALCLSLPRWKTARFQLQSGAGAQFSEKLLTRAENLEHLALTRLTSDESAVQVIMKLADAPHLRSLEVRDVNVARVAKAITKWLPLNQLARLCIKGCYNYWTGIHHVCRYCHSLEWLDLEFRTLEPSSDPWEGPVAIFSFPELRLLRITIENTPSADLLSMLFFDCPQVELLSMSMTFPDPNIGLLDFVDGFISGLDRPPHVLRLASIPVEDMETFFINVSQADIPVVVVDVDRNEITSEEWCTIRDLPLKCQSVRLAEPAIGSSEMQLGWWEGDEFLPPMVEKFFSDESVSPLDLRLR
ncbi:hypothetical protein NP233_g2875 [Leucocoprinus birnbaumii]|uniref:F-box domain-containing protein n=1 Tax=Leucocoprinus birnbaumii TaxID=56174 RepID=A0AAD5YUG4_9AGAR|nr:hypothetical protein NP233_g2875 [Leucocoprinus birnbaumii]